MLCPVKKFSSSYASSSTTLYDCSIASGMSPNPVLMSRECRITMALAYPSSANVSTSRMARMS